MTSKVILQNIIPDTKMKIIIVATKNPKATCRPHKMQNIKPRTPNNIMAIARSNNTPRNVMNK